MNKFSERLRDVRKARSLTQEELAEKADISRVMVTRYETGQVIPTVEVLISLADALEISIDYLLGRDYTAYLSTPVSNGNPSTPLPHSKSAKHPFPQNIDELENFVLQILKEHGLLTK